MKITDKINYDIDVKKKVKKYTPTVLCFLEIEQIVFWLRLNYENIDSIKIIKTRELRHTNNQLDCNVKKTISCIVILIPSVEISIIKFYIHACH